MTLFAQHVTDLQGALENKSEELIESILNDSPLLESNFILDDHSLKNYFTLMRELRDVNQVAVDGFLIELALKTKFKEPLREFTAPKPDLKHIWDLCCLSKPNRLNFLGQHPLSITIPNAPEFALPRKH